MPTDIWSRVWAQATPFYLKISYQIGSAAHIRKCFQSLIFQSQFISNFVPQHKTRKRETSTQVVDCNTSFSLLQRHPQSFLCKEDLANSRSCDHKISQLLAGAILNQSNSPIFWRHDQMFARVFSMPLF